MRRSTGDPSRAEGAFGRRRRGGILLLYNISTHVKRPRRRAASVSPRAAKHELSSPVPSIALIVGVTVVVYAGILRAPFLFDDHATVLQNSEISSIWAAPANTPLAGRPLAHATLALNHAIGGFEPLAYHATNIALHIVCAVLLFGIVRRSLLLTGKEGPWGQSARVWASAVALLWAVHPLTSEPVAYVTQRTESLMAAFFLCALYASIRSLRSGRAVAWKAFAVSACVAGGFAKETIAVAPLAVVLFDGVFAFPGFREAIAARWRFYLALCTAWLPLAYHLLAGGQTASAGFATAVISPREYFLTQPAMIARYFWLSVWPKDLVLYYGWARPVTISAAAPFFVAIGVVFALAAAATARRRALGFLGLFVFLTLGPTSSVIPIATEVAAERRMYLPMCAIAVLGALLVARLVRQWPHPRRAFAVAIGGVAILLGARTMARTAEYSSPLTMARTILARWPTANAEYLVGSESIAAGDRAGGVPHLRRAAVGYPPARFALGSALLLEGAFDDGAAALEAFVRDEPASLASRNAHALLANGYAERQRFADAVPHYRAYLEAFGSDADAWNALGIAEARSGRSADSLTSFRRAAQLRPGEPGFWMNLGAALAEQGDTQAAQRAFDNARRIDPNISVPRLPAK